MQIAKRVGVTALLLLALPLGAPWAQSVHAHRDASGQWVFTDRGTGPDRAEGEGLTLAHTPAAMRVAIERSDAGGFMRLTAVNDCLCVVTLRVAITQSDFTEVPRGASYPTTLEPHTRQVLLEAHESANTRALLQFETLAALGSP